jgi:PAS domain-containing protein
MTNDDELSQIIALQKQIERLREQLRQHGVDSADAGMEATRRDFRHDREMRTERGKTDAADLRAEAESERADRADVKRTELQGLYDELSESGEFNRQVLESTTDCIKVLDLDGKLIFMNAGGLRTMEIDDFSAVALCAWNEFWPGEERTKADEAVAVAANGGIARFEARAPTAKGFSLRWS